ncbi:hypothetical protein IQ508_002306 [Salmonella enterica]|nr:hypothetical protein [Salmonella enterica]EGL4569786.1 hypothetical protein [Salmonella enterica]EGL4583429.1 hypothetical protein [Salmonella enterica]EGL4601185.1 hypothetical protein [Salmonella enterica]EGL4634706.1 hypothetical protein [Salmonella enterica]
MLSGKELGLAIEQAINKKLALGTVRTKAKIARHFEIKPPSIHDWIKKGSISKDKLPELWRYFSDVRAYVSTMDEKARKWLQSNKSSYKSKAS